MPEPTFTVELTGPELVKYTNAVRLELYSLQARQARRKKIVDDTARPRWATATVAKVYERTKADEDELATLLAKLEQAAK